MRMMLRSFLAFALNTIAWASSLATFVSDLALTVCSCIRDAVTWSFDFIPRLADRAQPIRRIWMAATALNDRQVGGVRIHGCLGRPAVRMLAG